MSDMELSKIQLADGTVLNAKLNGTEYESEEVIDASVFTDDNLSSVTIDDVDMGEMKLNSTYPFGDGIRFSLCELTEDEKKIKSLTDDLLTTQLALAEMYESMESSVTK